MLVKIQKGSEGLKVWKGRMEGGWEGALWEGGKNTRKFLYLGKFGSTRGISKMIFLPICQPTQTSQGFCFFCI